jgi:hypothetical protein
MNDVVDRLEMLLRGEITHRKPCITRGRGSWLFLTPWGTFTSYSLPANWRTLLAVTCQCLLAAAAQNIKKITLPRPMPA